MAPCLRGEVALTGQLGRRSQPHAPPWVAAASLCLGSPVTKSGLFFSRTTLAWPRHCLQGDGFGIGDCAGHGPTRLALAL